jgi:hypothetical protein
MLVRPVAEKLHSWAGEGAVIGAERRAADAGLTELGRWLLPPQSLREALPICGVVVGAVAVHTAAH